MPTAPLTADERAYLLALARATIEKTTGASSAVTPDEAALTQRLREPGAAFVTLHTRSGALRGCIGSLVAHRPLIVGTEDRREGIHLRRPQSQALEVA